MDLPLRDLDTSKGLLPLFLLDGVQIPKRCMGSPGSLLGRRAPKPRLEGGDGVSQLDERRRELQGEQIACTKGKGRRASGVGDLGVPRVWGDSEG